VNQLYQRFDYPANRRFIGDFRGLDLRAGIFKQSMGARNRVGIGLSYQPARLHRLEELLSWNRILGSLKFENSGSVSEMRHVARV
jgi:hypothetical protein